MLLISPTASVAFASFNRYRASMTPDLELPTHETSPRAGQALRRFAPIAKRARTSNHVNVRADGASDSEQPVSVPRQAFDLFLEVLGQLANGNAVSIMPVQPELTAEARRMDLGY